MSNKIIYSILLLLTLTNNAICQGIKNKDTLLIMLSYGAFDAKTQHASNVVAREFGFKYYTVSGYSTNIISDSGKSIYINIDRIKKYNDSIGVLIGNKHGGDWRNKFNYELARVIKNEEKVKEIILNDSSVTNLREDFIEDAYHGLIRFIIDQTLQKNTYLVKVYTQSKNDNGYSQIIIYKFFVNTRKNCISILSNKVEPFVPTDI